MLCSSSQHLAAQGSPWWLETGRGGSVSIAVRRTQPQGRPGARARALFAQRSPSRVGGSGGLRLKGKLGSWPRPASLSKGLHFV